MAFFELFCLYRRPQIGVEDLSRKCFFQKNVIIRTNYVKIHHKVNLYPFPPKGQFSIMKPYSNLDVTEGV